jgi:4-alpha-glucanotransferase
MLGILALESHRNSTIIIGEDLGTVPSYIRERLEEAQVLSCRLFYFEKDSNGEWKNPPEYPSQSLVSITTHDLPTLEGYWEGRDIWMREQLGLFSHPEKVQRAWEDRNRDKASIIKALNGLGLLPEGVTSPPAQLTEEVQLAIVDYLARTPCWILLLNHEDIFRDRDQMNLPGTLTEYPNWTARMRYSLEELLTDPGVERIVIKISLLLEGLQA